MVDIGDQPLYALCKQIQLLIPGYPLETYLPLMGGLHIEQVMLTMHGQLVVGTGIEEIISVAQLSQAGAATLLASASQNCPTRYVIEVCV